MRAGPVGGQDVHRRRRTGGQLLDIVAESQNRAKRRPGGCLARPQRLASSVGRCWTYRSFNAAVPQARQVADPFRAGLGNDALTPGPEPNNWATAAAKTTRCTGRGKLLLSASENAREHADTTRLRGLTAGDPYGEVRRLARQGDTQRPSTTSTDHQLGERERNSPPEPPADAPNHQPGTGARTLTAQISNAARFGFRRVTNAPDPGAALRRETQLGTDQHASNAPLISEEPVQSTSAQLRRIRGYTFRCACTDRSNAN